MARVYQQVSGLVWLSQDSGVSLVWVCLWVLPGSSPPSVACCSVFAGRGCEMSWVL